VANPIGRRWRVIEIDVTPNAGFKTGAGFGVIEKPMRHR
jgi:hypothetical protein